MSEDRWPLHILFDLDGTLVDSSPLHDLAFRSVIGEHLPHLLETFDYDAVRGMPTWAVFEAMGVKDSELRETLTAQKQSHYRQSLRDGRIQTMAGATELVGWLRDGGRGTHIVTGSSGKSVEAVLESTQLRSLFEYVVTADNVAKGKPAPDGYLACVEQIGVSAADCIAVEDAPSGVEAAREAGLAVIGVFDPGIQETTDYWFPDLRALHAEFPSRGKVAI